MFMEFLFNFKRFFFKQPPKRENKIRILRTSENFLLRNPGKIFLKKLSSFPFIFES